MELNLGSMKDLIWVLQLYPLNDIMMESLMVYLECFTGMRNGTTLGYSD